MSGQHVSYEGFQGPVRRRILVVGRGPVKLLGAGPFGIDALNWSWDWGWPHNGTEYTAAMLLQDHLGRRPDDATRDAFASEVVARLPAEAGWVLTDAQIQDWLANRPLVLGQPLGPAEGGRG